MTELNQSPTLGKPGDFGFHQRVRVLTQEDGRPPVESDALLVSRVKAGDADAAGILFHRHKNKVFLQCNDALPSRDDALDVMSETFLEVFKSIDRYDSIVSFSGLLRIIARRRCDDWFREYYGSERPHQRPIDDVVSEPLIARQHEAGSIDHIDRLELKRALDELPDYLRVVVLQYAAGYSGREIAHQLGISPDAVKMRHSRAKKQLRELLQLGEDGGRDDAA